MIYFQIDLPMGSLATVKLLKEKTPTEITKNLLKDISSKSQSLTMGGLFSRDAPKTAAPSPPVTLTKLLEEMAVKDDVTSKTVDTVIQGFLWSKEFREYLSADMYIAILRWTLLLLLVDNY